LTVDVSPREQNVTAGEAAEFSVSVKTINAPTVVNLAQLSANVQVSAISSVNQLTTSIIPESRVQVSSNHPAAFTLNVQASSQTETGDYAILVMAAWGAGVRPQVFGDVVIVHAQGVNKTSPDQYLQPVRLAIILTMLALILISAFSAYKLVRGRRGPKAANSA
jgi:isopentenyl phosphate kinase